MTEEQIYYSDGKKVIGKTKKIDGKIYLFDSNGYLVTDGIHEVNGKKYYSNKDGTVKCNQWVSHKYNKSGNTYYYATSTGKIVEYQLKKQSNSDIYLYVDGKLATAEDIPLNAVFNGNNYIDTSDLSEDLRKSLSNLESRTGYFNIGSHIYHLEYSNVKKCVICDSADKIIYESYNNANDKFYDLGSKKEMGHILGFAQFNSKGFASVGWLVNPQNRKSYVIIDEKVEKQSIDSPIIITNYSTKLNIVGGVNYSLTIANNSGKTINYIYYNVHVVNKVGDTVYDTISDKKTFRLKDTGPYAAGDVSDGIWEAMMYNYSGYEVVIDDVEIIYKDGTSSTVKGDDLLNLLSIFKASVKTE